MPLIEYGCYSCRKITESLIRNRDAIPESIQCEYCDSEDTVKLVSQVHHKMHSKAKYDDDFLGKAMPAMKAKKDTAEHFAEGKGSDESKMFELGEHIGGRIDSMLHRNFPPKK